MSITKAQMCSNYFVSRGEHAHMNRFLFPIYSGDFLKVYHFRRCLALYVRDPRVGNYRVGTCVASRVSRRYHYKPIKSYYQPVYDSPIRDVCAGSQTPIILPVYTCEANAGTRRKAFIQSNPLKWHCSNRVGI